MATLADILTVLDRFTLVGDPSTRVEGVSHDSRKIRRGWLFVAMKGEVADGHNYIGKAIEAGASAIIAAMERPAIYKHIAWVRVEDPRRVLGPVAALMSEFPTRRMCVVGITGTNGKTTLTYLLEAVLRAAGKNPAVLGTIAYRWSGTERAAHHTTPEAPDLQEMFVEMVHDGVTHVLMEASSHGLHRGRLDGCDFDVGVFTNLSQDHLDYHGNLEEYYQAKRLLFSMLLPASNKTRTAAVVNGDDPYGTRLGSEIRDIEVIRFGNSSAFDVYPEHALVGPEGISATLKTLHGPMVIQSLLTGPFNLSNILAAVSVAQTLGIDPDAIGRGIELVGVVPGRLERVASRAGSIFVDYAHTPHALKNVLEAMSMIKTGRVITVMGCGGDRDKGKRPLMGREAAAGSDLVVITSDNPRSEDPHDIIRQVEDGVVAQGFTACNGDWKALPGASGWYRVLPDRREAIAWALGSMAEGDMVLVAGKGHETYQEIGGVRHPFDDRQVVTEELQKLGLAAGSGNTGDGRTRERKGEGSP